MTDAGRGVTITRMEMQFILGTQVNCSDGARGQLQRIFLDPAERKVAHLVIEPGHSKPRRIATSGSMPSMAGSGN